MFMGDVSMWQSVAGMAGGSRFDMDTKKTQAAAAATVSVQATAAVGKHPKNVSSFERGKKNKRLHSPNLTDAGSSTRTQPNSSHCRR